MGTIVLAVMLLAATADTTVTLDAAEKHIVKTSYHDDQAVTLSGRDAGGWRLDAGAAIDAQRIDLRMRDVRGTVRFRADPSRVENLLKRHR